MQVRTIASVLIAMVLAVSCTTITAGKQNIIEQQRQQALPIKSMADALVARFSARGWAGKMDTQKQASKLAGFLSRGWAKTNHAPKTNPVDTYLASLSATETGLLEAMTSEIILATTETKTLRQHVQDPASQNIPEPDLRIEMLALERAVLATRKAKKLFVGAIRRAKLTDNSLQEQLAQFTVQIDALTAQTNALNQRRQAVTTG
ncbi:hypothetical protein MNBD_ALPHA06-1590 [hydrothermal vent metagenome]|uniref:Uncharacterized protein n=1 Tax=hydrothermal vent metagenome TaxID=652676 RepID=A0A3B0S935_9ZZZZ